MRRLGVAGVLLLSVMAVFVPTHSRAQDSSTESSRKIVNKVAPVYPDLARKMAIRGVVRVEVVVAPNGSVKSVQIKGGHPVLAQAAQTAVSKWKWEPASHETTLVVEVKFDE